MFDKVNVPVLGIVENMSYYVCSHCGHREEIFDNGGRAQSGGGSWRSVPGRDPHCTPNIRVSGDNGKPTVTR